MKARILPVSPYLAGAFAFLFAWIPVSLGAVKKKIIANADASNDQVAATDFQRDRQTHDPESRGLRADIRLSERVRKALVADESLSDSAKDVKIVTSKGNVILKGMVESPAEKTKVEEIARQTARTGLVENDLEVRTQ